MNPDSLKSSLHLHVPNLSRLKKLPKHPVQTQLSGKKAAELSISPSTPNRYRVSYSPASPPTENLSKHTRSSTVSPRGFKFISATATSPFEEFQTPTTDFPNSERSEESDSSLSIEEDSKQSQIFSSSRRNSEPSFYISDPCSPQLEKFVEAKPPELQEKISSTTRLTTNSVDEHKLFEAEYSVMGRKIYCDKCEKNVLTEFLFRNAEKSLWEKILCGVCYKGIGQSFREIVHFCSECGNEVALIRFKQEEVYQ